MRWSEVCCIRHAKNLVLGLCDYSKGDDEARDSDIGVQLVPQDPGMMGSSQAGIERHLVHWRHRSRGGHSICGSNWASRI